MTTRRAARTTATRTTVLLAGAVLALATACGSDSSSTAAPADSASAAPSSSAPASSSAAAPSSAASSSAAAPSSAPGGSVGAATPAPGAAGAPTGTDGSGSGGGTGAGAAGGSTAVPQVAEVDPAKVGTFLDALHAKGIPAGPTDQINEQYAPVICAALASGQSTDAVRQQLLAAGQLYTSITPLSAEQVADAFLSAAQTSYC